MRALVVVGPELVKQGLVEHFRSSGCQVEYAGTRDDTLELVRRYEFDVMVLSLDVLDIGGVELIRRMRASRLDIPVLALSQSTHPAPRVAALTAGADDVVVLPADPAELQARLHALVRRTRGQSKPVLSAGPVSVNMETHKVTVHGNPVHLTGKETAVLELMFLRRNVPLSKETFLTHLYASADHEPDPKIVDVFVCKLRRKLADAGAPDVVETVWGRGYMVRSASTQREVVTEPTVIPTHLAPVD